MAAKGDEKEIGWIDPTGKFRCFQNFDIRDDDSHFYEYEIDNEAFLLKETKLPILEPLRLCSAH